MKIKTIFFLLFLFLLPLFSSQKLKFTGIQNSVINEVTLKVLKEAYSRMGIEISIDFYPAKRSLIISNDGINYDGEIHRIGGIEKEFPNLVPISIPINILEGVVVANKVNFMVNGWKSLNPYLIGIRRGIVFTTNGTAGMNRVVLNTNEHLFQMLAAQRIDLVVISRINALKYIPTEQRLKLKILEPPVEVYNMYHYLHKKNAHLIPELTSILKEMQKEGIIHKIRNDYIKHLNSK